MINFLENSAFRWSRLTKDVLTNVYLERSTEIGHQYILFSDSSGDPSKTAKRGPPMRCWLATRSAAGENQKEARRDLRHSAVRVHEYRLRVAEEGSILPPEEFQSVGTCSVRRRVGASS